ncbi:asparagine synthase (glutamine-hydrolysing) [Trichlorobacter thiogenes]|uniref:asparagine synthase (glutamine-hydrolyzing) n=1 Tax=Trichlorobacter thiogenes TaxID=115783 RepID=A0A1T4PE20_9BACT|nr:asparagine synthase (glutamine-hydrolyzing) [Trichlorobacter thiogenes]SJZ89813.1 asparagine synthase (glutamine-hydrolysing) [Trichlorobacter thiogenes]
MCGFAGAIWKKTAPHFDKKKELLRIFENGLLHRGPDERGVYIGQSFAVIHRRLSIIDIAQGQQPMLSEDGNVGIAYNGEVYNFQELRTELQANGYIFKTNSDTEVILQLFLENGVNCFARLDGMFSIFIWDTHENASGVFYLVRDHLGVKPLYVYEDNEQIAFSSELRPLLAIPGADLSLNPFGLQSYLTFRYTHAPDTIFKNIRRVAAGNVWTISGDSVFQNRFWDLPAPLRHERITADEASERLYELLRASVKVQQVSEVPVGLLLSGGLDSSVIARLCCDIGVHLKSFSIGFPTINEFQYSHEVADAFGLSHTTVETSPKAIIERFETVVDAMDEPIADPACFPLHILCEEIKKNVTVVLSGEGADEMLAGYPQYGYVYNASADTSDSHFERFLHHSWYFTEESTPIKADLDPTRLWRHKSYFSERSLLSGMLAYDLKTWLPENLMMKADKILMSHSLEGRFPFLSKSVVEFISSLPESFKMNDTNGKWLLRKTFMTQLPKTIITRPKMGFSVPVDLLVLELKERAYSLISDLETREPAVLLDLPEIRRKFEAHYSGAQPNALWVWTLLVLLQWFRNRMF